MRRSCAPRWPSWRARTAGAACAVPRDQALEIDPEVRAATRSARANVVDLTQEMCGSTVCDAVVGGALVHKDVHHLTRAFATTLAPSLLRQLDRLPLA